MQIHEDIRFQSLIEQMETLHIQSRTDEMRLLLEELQVLAETEQDNIGLAAAYFYRDILSDAKPNSEAYMQHAKRSLKIATAHNIPYYQMKASNSLGIMYSELSDFHSSLEYYLHALHIAQDNPQFCYASVVLNNVGNLFVWLEDYEEAVVYLERAYLKSIAENCGDTQLIALIILNLIELYSNIGNFKKVQEWEEMKPEVLGPDEKSIIVCIDMINDAQQLLEDDRPMEAAKMISAFMEQTLELTDYIYYIYLFRCSVNALRLGIRLKDFSLCAALAERMEEMQSGVAMTSFAFNFAAVRVEYYEAFQERLGVLGHVYYEEYYRQSQNRIEQLRNTYARSLSVKIAFEEVKDENKTVHLQNEQLQRDMERDIFTNLYNKVSTEIHVRAAMLTRPVNTIQGFMLIDIDLFKRINDYYGHSFGDKVITAVAQTLNSLEGYPKIVGRFGGDEFLVFLDKQETIDTVLEAAQQLLTKVRCNIKLPDDRVQEITLSIGICIIDCPMEFDDAFTRADKALYRAKELGRNRFIVSPLRAPAHCEP